MKRWQISNRARRWLLYVDRSGVGFLWHGDEVIWLWPWRRWGDKRPWLSIGFGGTFESLAAIDAMWADYFERERVAARAEEPEEYYPALDDDFYPEDGP